MITEATLLRALLSSVQTDGDSGDSRTLSAPRALGGESPLSPMSAKFKELLSGSGTARLALWNYLYEGLQTSDYILLLRLKNESEMKKNPKIFRAIVRCKEQKKSE